MSRPKLTNVEKQWRKKKAAEKRAKEKADREKIKEQLKLRAKREKAFRKLMPGGLFRFMYCADNTAGLRVDSSTAVVGYDQLYELVDIFSSTRINLGVEMDHDYDTYNEYDTGYLYITIENVDWTKLDNVS